MITASIFEAKTSLSELVKKAQKGEEVIITSGRKKTPVALWKRSILLPKRGLVRWRRLDSN
jgi:Antitoxin Phd_YefM, type II toxin-antitoxin system